MNIGLYRNLVETCVGVLEGFLGLEVHLRDASVALLRDGARCSFDPAGLGGGSGGVTEALEGPFSAVPRPNFATENSICSIFQKNIVMLL